MTSVILAEYGVQRAHLARALLCPPGTSAAAGRRRDDRRDRRRRGVRRAAADPPQPGRRRPVGAAVRLQLALRAPGDRLLRPGRQQQPVPALLVAVGRGAVLPRLPAPPRRPARPGGRRWARPAVTTAGLALLLVASVATQQYWSSRSPLRAYYGTEARVYQMLAGATLAWLLSRPRGRRVVASTPRSARTLAGVVAALGVVLLIAAATDLWAMTPSRRGYVAALVSVTLIAALEFAGAAPGDAAAVAHPDRLPGQDLLWHLPLALADHRLRPPGHRPQPGGPRHHRGRRCHRHGVAQLRPVGGAGEDVTAPADSVHGWR